MKPIPNSLIYADGDFPDVPYEIKFGGIVGKGIPQEDCRTFTAARWRSSRLASKPKTTRRMKSFASVFELRFARSGSQPLLDRFSFAIEAVQGNSQALFGAGDEAHNELCIASALLENSDPAFTSLEYEPALPGCAKSIDFRATTDGGVTVYVDVKTIKPLPKDRWEQFERALTEGWFRPNIAVVLSKEGLGGELWHNMFAARGRMPEYSFELEQKISEGNLAAGNSLFVLALCGEGFSWHEDEFEDFVSYYYSQNS